MSTWGLVPTLKGLPIKGRSGLGVEQMSGSSVPLEWGPDAEGPENLGKGCVSWCRSSLGWGLPAPHTAPPEILSSSAQDGLHSSLLESTGTGEGGTWVPCWNQTVWAVHLWGVFRLLPNAPVLGECHPSLLTFSQCWRPHYFTRRPIPSLDSSGVELK